MKGVIFNVVEEVVTERFGADTWDDLLEAAELVGAYTALGNYDDEELAALVAAAARTLDVSEPDVLRLVGRLGFSRLAARYGRLLDGHTTSRTVLADLNAVIHPQVLAIYPGATVPEFDFRDRGESVELDYRSGRGLCHLAEGLAEGVAHHFGEEVEVRQPTCRHRGDRGCLVTVRYRRGD